MNKNAFLPTIIHISPHNRTIGTTAHHCQEKTGNKLGIISLYDNNLELFHRNDYTMNGIRKENSTSYRRNLRDYFKYWLFLEFFQEKIKK